MLTMPFYRVLFPMIPLMFKIWYFLKVYFIGALYLAKEWYIKYTGSSKGFSFQGLHKGPKHAVLTGATQGIGLEVAEQLLEFGFSITIGALMTSENCLNLENSLRSKFPNSKVSVWTLDLKSLKSVKHFAEKYLQSALPLHLLVNNAGVMYVPYEETEDGFEHHMAVNYLSHCLLTRKLLPRLINSSKPGECSRIVNTASSTHFVGDINFEDLQSRNCYSPIFGYLQSKLAIVMFTSALQRYLEEQSCNVTANSLHPGVVYTKLYKHVFWAPYVGPYLFKTPKEGAQTVLYCALSPDLEGVGGKYLEECGVVQPSAKAGYRAQQDRLWTMTWDLLDPWLFDLII